MNQSKKVPRFSDLTGQKFGALEVLGRTVNSPGGHTNWLCRCDCGTEKSVGARHLVTNKTISCGCLRFAGVVKANTKHGYHGTSIYEIWGSMIKRCTNPNAHAYADYGGRGITVCERWRKFENFLADMGDRPPGLSLDRIDFNGGYSKENCRWATMKEQQRNRRSNRLLTADGFVAPMATWAEELGVRYYDLQRHLYLGRSLEEFITKVYALE